MIISAQIVSAAGDFWSVQNCAKLLDVIGDSQELVENYPSCAALIDANNLQAVAAVKADFGGSVEQLMSAMNISFGMAGWLALGLHALGVEVYVSLSLSSDGMSGCFWYNADMSTTVTSHPKRVGTSSSSQL